MSTLLVVWYVVWMNDQDGIGLVLERVRVVLVVVGGLVAMLVQLDDHVILNIG